MEICLEPLKQNVWKMQGECTTHSMWLQLACPKRLQKEARHTLARVVHCKVYDLPFSSKWYEHSPVGITDNEEVNILWNFTIQTDREINHRRPDITVHGKNNNKFLTEDIAVPGDSNVESKLRERELGKISRLSEGNI